MLSISPIPAFDDNYIWLLENNNQAVVVDPGDSEPVKQVLSAKGLNLQAIIITHHHADHTGGVNTLCESFDVPVYGPQNSKFKGVTHPLIDGEQITLLSQSFTVKAVPGHTLDHICFFLEDSKNPAIFCGDSLFLAGCGRVFEGTMEQMFAAMEYFNQLPSNTKVYCTHEYSLANLAFASAVEPTNAAIQQEVVNCQAKRANDQPTLPSSIETERLINPFLRYDEPSVKESAEQFSGRTLPNQLEIFSALRGWKDNF